jgi:xanthine dehydrogenase accessory factor
MKQNIFVRAGELLSSGERVVLARIIKRTGSAPRAVGSECIIREDGSVVGTIGGGSLEYMVAERAKVVLSSGKSEIRQLELTGNDVTKTDMICGGAVDVYLEPLFPENRETVELFASLKELTESNKRGMLLTLVAEGISAMDTQSRMLKKEKGSQGEIRGLTEKILGLDELTEPQLIPLPDGDACIFAEHVEAEPMLFLFGAGHVSTFVAPLAKMVGFRVTVIDDRPEFANSERFPDADEIHVVPFSEAFNRIPISDTSYITIITRGHTFDRGVLEAALHTEPAYVGMIGSRKKRNLIYQALRDSGISNEKIESVHSPIGIDIAAETPEEIAVSIVGELIKVRAERARREQSPA